MLEGAAVAPVKGEVVDSQKRRCFVKEVTELNDWPHLPHLTCRRQLACMRRWRQRFEN